MDVENETTTVRYTVKELLGKIDQKLDALDAKLDHKADSDTVEQLSARISNLESWRNRFIGAGIVMSILFSAFGFIVARAIA